MDPSVGLPYFDLGTVPLEAAQAFPFLKENRAAVSFPRIYFVAIASELCLAAPVVSVASSLTDGAETLEARLRVVVLTYNAILVGDLESRTISHNMPLTEDIVAAFTVSGDESWLAVITSSRGDLLIQLPVRSDAVQMQKCLMALYHFHTQRHLVVQRAASEADLRSRLQLSQASSPFGGGGGSRTFSTMDVQIPRQLWSVANLSVPLISDRMSHVKETLAQVENETKGAIAAAVRDIEAAQADLDGQLAEVRSAIAETSEELNQQLARQQQLNEQERELHRTRDETEEKERLADALKVEFITKEQAWQEIVHQRLDEERKQKQKLIKQQRQCNETVSSREEEIAALQAEIDQLGAKLWSFDTDEYADLVSVRDAALLTLQLKTGELEDMQSEKERYRKAKLKAVSKDALETNEALRKLLEKTQREADEKVIAHDDLRGDVDMLLEDISTLEEQDLLLLAREREHEALVRAAKAKLVALDDRAAVLQAEIAEFRGQERKFYYAEKSRAAEAIERRRKAEQTTQRQRSAQMAQRMELQQQLFAERLRLDSELKRRPQL